MAIFIQIATKSIKTMTIAVKNFLGFEVFLPTIIGLITVSFLVITLITMYEVRRVVMAKKLSAMVGFITKSSVYMA